MGGISVHKSLSDDELGQCFLFILNVLCDVVSFSGYLCIEGEGCSAVFWDGLLFVERL